MSLSTFGFEHAQDTAAEGGILFLYGTRMPDAHVFAGSPYA